MQKLLIAEHSEILSREISKVLEKNWKIYTCADGYTAVDTLKYLNPDALILNLGLPEKDGLSVLEECFPQVPPTTLALSAYISPYVACKAESLGVGYIAYTSSTVAEIAKRLTDMYEVRQSKPTRTVQNLRKLQMRVELDGYVYAVACINILAKHPNMRLHKELYPEVAKICNAKDVQCVERALRFAIEDAYGRRDPEAWRYYFPEDDCPSNKAFITRMAELIR